MNQRHRARITALAATLILFFLISLAMTETGPYFPAALIGSTALAVVFFQRLFDSSRAFLLGLVNFFAVYACVFAFLRVSNFAEVSDGLAAIAYAMPPLGFLAGVWLRRRRIRSIVTSDVLRETRHPGALFLWLFPLALMGTATFWIPGVKFEGATVAAVLLISMAAIALLVAALAEDICLFLLDSSLLFEHFYKSISRLILPAFAFLTFYSLLVILFGVIYRLMDRFSEVGHFARYGQAVELNFGDALYFSLVTLATVGYGDITPQSAPARVVVVFEVVMGILLLLFGFAEIMRYLKGRDQANNGPR